VRSATKPFATCFWSSVEAVAGALSGVSAKTGYLSLASATVFPSEPAGTAGADVSEAVVSGSSEPELTQVVGSTQSGVLEQALAAPAINTSAVSRNTSFDARASPDIRITPNSAREARQPNRAPIQAAGEPSKRGALARLAAVHNAAYLPAEPNRETNERYERIRAGRRCPKGTSGGQR
jgi:hypothetical protein